MTLSISTKPVRPLVYHVADVDKLQEKDLFPLRDSFFEGIHVKIPFDYAWLLEEEYGMKALTRTTYEQYGTWHLPQIPDNTDYHI